MTSTIPGFDTAVERFRVPRLLDGLVPATEAVYDAPSFVQWK